MLDGLLGRSAFSSKCKSLIKPTRTRIDALRKRADAKQRFLKQDLAKLLANGLDLNAYGRTEEFIAGLNLLSCYTFIDQSCEYIYKQLSSMQKLGQCPEECRETVASLMFAAARFSDLPELRDLRDVFQNRYGDGLECFVNQVFVEKIASKPPVMEKKIKLLQDIAAEFSIQWDSKGFKQRMDKPTTLAQDQPKKLEPFSVTDDKYKQPNGNNLFRKNDYRFKGKERIEHVDQGAALNNYGNVPLSIADDEYKLLNGNNLFRKNDQLPKEKERIEHVNQGATLHNNGNGIFRRREVFVGREDSHHKERIDHRQYDGNANVRKKEVFVVREVKHTGKEDIDGYSSKERKRFAYENRVKMPVDDDDRVNIGKKERHVYKQEPLFTGRSRVETIETGDSNDDHLFRERPDMTSSSSREETIETRDDNDDHLFRGRKDVTSSIDRPGTAFLEGEKPNLLNNGKDANKKVLEEEASGFKSRYNNSLPPPPYIKSNIPQPPYIKPHNSDRMKKEADHDRNYPNDIPLPKPRSIRRKHHSKSSSSHDDDVGSSEDARIVKRISSSRRKERKGLQIIFDDQHYHHKDHEEKMMDKLLLHYSSKKTSYDDITKLRKKKSPSSSKDDEVEMVVPPMRSISLPHEPSGELEPKTKVYARANSFHPDNQAKHVHPKLPDYDDLAARFAALRGQ